jgi:hypothetical protein
MRIAVLTAVILSAPVFLSACAGDTLELKPPPGVDFTGHWKLNEADSDDPLRVSQAAADAAANAGTAGTGGSGGGSGGGNGGGGRGARGGVRGAPGTGYPAGPIPPSVSVMSAALSWPGKQLEIKQVAGVVAITSEGRNRVCEPSPEKKHHHHHAPDDDALPSARDAPPPSCGWSEGTLVFHTGDPDEDRPPSEERYSLSEDGQRLIEVVGFKGGRSNGFTMSRVWDKVE